MGYTPNELVGSIGKAINKNTTTRHEEEQERSSRHSLDMASDSFLAKAVRPFVLIFLLLAYFAIELLDIKVSDAFHSTVKNWGDLVFMFYFASRGIEKIAKTANRQIRFLKRDERKKKRNNG